MSTRTERSTSTPVVISSRGLDRGSDPPGIAAPMTILVRRDRHRLLVALRRWIGTVHDRARSPRVDTLHVRSLPRPTAERGLTDGELDVAGLILCASCGDGGNEPADAAPPSTTSRETTTVESSIASEPITLTDPVVAWLDGVDQNWDAFWPAAQVLIENGCVMLAAPDGAGEPVLTVWPIGTAWDQEASAIVLADGFTVHEGDVVAVGGGGIPFDQGSGNNVDVAGLGSDGLAKLEACASTRPGVQLWLLDADGTVGPGTSAD